MNFLALLILAPISFVVGAFAGRYVQWKYWEMDKPYEDRLRSLKPRVQIRLSVP